MRNTASGCQYSIGKASTVVQVGFSSHNETCLIRDDSKARRDGLLFVPPVLYKIKNMEDLLLPDSIHEADEPFRMSTDNNNAQ